MIPTPATPTATYNYPNRMGRIILLSMEEIIGRNGVNAILKLGNLSSLVDNYPPDNNELDFSFTSVTCLTEMLSAPTVRMGDGAWRSVLGVPVSTMA